MDRLEVTGMIAIIVAMCVIAVNGALAQTAPPTPQRIQQMEQELQQMRDAIRAQQDLLRQQEERLRQQEQNLEQLRRESASAPPPAPAPRLPGGLLLNPEMRVEGNMVGNKTYGLERDAETQGFSSDRFSLKTVEVGFRASVDPFAEFEAVIEGQRLLEIDLEGERELENGLELEVAHLTLPRLPFRTRGRIGLMRTSFGEYNDDDPEEFPQIDPPNVIVNLFGEEGEGWKDLGFNLNYQFGNPWSDKLTHLVWFGMYAGENITRRLTAAVWIGPSTSPAPKPFLSWAFGPAPNWALVLPRDSARPAAPSAMMTTMTTRMRTTAMTDNGGSLDTYLVNIHFEIDWQPATYSLDRGFSFLGEFFYAHAEREDDDIDSIGGYALAQYRLNSRWAIGGRFDASECPGFANSLCALIDSDKPIEERFEWAMSPILSYAPSRFLTFRLQYKHTGRNYADHSDELMAQALFIIGYERPEPF